MTSLTSLAEELAPHKHGDKVSVTYTRSGAEKTVEVTRGEIQDGRIGSRRGGAPCGSPPLSAFSKVLRTYAGASSACRPIGP
ncbi:hypothetical protein [Streptomyces sp. AcE210]|uniref:hypothetical protein n=1 Tax=Streptomyces sp. AcE210 TaxID=2292703 RepID=UPI0010584AFD|nr:hypothetical protein [Streptomyces sp. AcE210]